MPSLDVAKDVTKRVVRFVSLRSHAADDARRADTEPDVRVLSQVSLHLRDGHESRGALAGLCVDERVCRHALYLYSVMVEKVVDRSPEASVGEDYGR